MRHPDVPARAAGSRPGRPLPRLAVDDRAGGRRARRGRRQPGARAGRASSPSPSTSSATTSSPRTRTRASRATVNVGLRRALETGRDAVLVNAGHRVPRGRLARPHGRAHRHAGPPGGRRRRPAAVSQRLHPARRRLLLPAHARVLAPLPVRPGEPARGAASPCRCPVTAALQLIRHETLEPIGLYDESFRLALRGRRLLPARVRGRPRVHLRAVASARSTTRACSAAADARRSRSGTQPSRSAPARQVARRRPLALLPRRRYDRTLPRTLFVGIANGAVAWYRCALPASVLGADWLGVRGEPPRPRVPSAATSRPTSRSTTRASYDVVVVQQVAGREWLKTIRALAGRRRHGALRDRRLAPRRAQARGPRARRQASTARAVERYELCMRGADGIICSTDVARRRYRPLNPRTWICRNGIDLAATSFTRPERDYVGIGWSGGTGHARAVDAVGRRGRRGDARARPTRASSASASRSRTGSSPSSAPRAEHPVRGHARSTRPR